MNDVQSLLALPLETIAILGSGYIGYRIAYTGLDSHHRAVDITFLSLAFGLVSKIAIGLMAGYFNHDYVTVLVALFCTILAAGFWRRWGVLAFSKLLRVTNVSFSDGSLTAWDQMRTSTTDRPTQIIVRKTDGSAVMCDYLKTYEHLPHGPCCYGQDGSVSLYITHFRAPDGDKWDKADVKDEFYGVALTYIPASQITEIELRLLI